MASISGSAFYSLLSLSSLGSLFDLDKASLPANLSAFYFFFSSEDSFFPPFLCVFLSFLSILAKESTFSLLSYAVSLPSVSSTFGFSASFFFSVFSFFSFSSFFASFSSFFSSFLSFLSFFGLEAFWAKIWWCWWWWCNWWWTAARWDYWRSSAATSWLNPPMRHWFSTFLMFSYISSIWALTISSV